MTDEIRTPNEAIEAAALWHEKEAWPDSPQEAFHWKCANAIRALAARIPEPDDEAIVDLIIQKPSWQMALTDVIEMPTIRANERALVRISLAALREAGALK